MKVLVKNGASTKNTPSNSIDSFLLALNTNYIDGIEVNLNLTKDNNLIVYHCDSIMGHYKHKFSNLTLSDIDKYNLGTKVKKHNIITLDKLLKIFDNTSKLLVLNIDSHNNNKILVDKLISIINNYPNDNIYIKSSSKEIILYIKDKIHNAHIGAVIMDREKYFWNLDLDFYSISLNDISLLPIKSDIEKKLIKNKFIMLNDINNIDNFNEVKNYLGENIVYQTLIVTSNIVNLASIL